MTQNYVICTTQRSGSTFFCECLKRTKLLGTPAEWLVFLEFNDASLSPLEIALKAEPIRQIIAKRSESQPTETGSKGWKIMWSTMHNMKGRLIAEDSSDLDQSFMNANFLNPKFIFFERANKIAQAISHSVMWKTNMSHATNAEQEAILKEKKKGIKIPDIEIDQYLKKLINDEKNWGEFFAKNEIEFLPVIYEDFCGDIIGGLTDVLHFLNVEHSADQLRDIGNSIAFRKTRSHFELDTAKQYIESRLLGTNDKSPN